LTINVGPGTCIEEQFALGIFVAGGLKPVGALVQPYPHE
jgi:hypothetical protein